MQQEGGLRHTRGQDVSSAFVRLKPQDGVTD